MTLLATKSLPTTWLTRHSGKQVLGAPLVIALATTKMVYRRVILQGCEQLHGYYHYLSATWSTAGSFYWCGQLLDATLVTSTSGSTTQPGPQPPVEVIVASMALSPELIGSSTTTREQTNTTNDSHLTLVRGSELR